MIQFILVLMNDLFMRLGLMVQGLMIDAAGARVCGGALAMSAADEEHFLLSPLSFFSFHLGRETVGQSLVVPGCIL